jgi:iduronate 2-sulfatase
MVGQLLTQLEVLGLSKSTIVVFVADHGHHNGENGVWGKQTTYELATHIPMMIHIPGQTDHGVVTRSLVEGVDLYPTIVQAAGLGTIPKCPPGSSDVAVCTEGKSFLPLVKNPDEPFRSAAFTQIRQGGFMVYAVRTDRHKYVAYARIKKKTDENGRYLITNVWDHGEFWTELYDLHKDPEERHNKTNSVDYKDVKERLGNKLRSFFTGAINVPIPPSKE